MDNSVLQTIENRVSLRVYDDREISREILGDFIEPPSPAALLIPAPLRALAGSVLLLIRLS